MLIMNDTKKIAFILGSHPKISFAELETVLEGNGTLERKDRVAFWIPEKEENITKLMEQLGGTIKIVEMVGIFEEDTMIEWLFERINRDTKFHFGFSLYETEPGMHVKKSWKTLKQLGMSLKRAMQSDNISARFVQSNDIALSSVIVHKERLLKNGVDICLFKGSKKIEFGFTRAVQPFQAFSKRDYGRPARDHKSGMLPPKLARMMINISQPTKKSTILDPFCGSGTVLQEALLMGFNKVIGTDKSKKAIHDSKANLEWMNFRNVELHAGEAEQLVRKHVLKKNSIDRIVFEGYLGPTMPNTKERPDVIKELNRLYLQTFEEFSKLLKKDGVIVAGLPFWKERENEHHLDINHIIGASNFEHIREPLIYRRQQSIVGREIISIKKK